MFENLTGESVGLSDGVIDGLVEDGSTTSATHSFELPDGIYAIGVYIDVNLNNKLDKNFVGIPKEPYAFSNNAEGFLGSPSFEKASFVIAGDTSLSIDM